MSVDEIEKSLVFGAAKYRCQLKMSELIGETSRHERHTRNLPEPEITPPVVWPSAALRMYQAQAIDYWRAQMSCWLRSAGLPPL